MRSLQQKDPFRLKSNPGSNKVYTALFVTLVLLAGAAVLFALNFFSPGGKFERDYNSNLYTWNTDHLATKLSQFSVSFKIMPINSTLRNRDQFIFDNKNSVAELDKALVNQSEFFNYEQSYFWYNNTVKNFPQFFFDEVEPNIEESEDFCLHLFWSPPAREKTYKSFTDVIGQPMCNNGNSSTKYIYLSTDPTTGVNFKLWKKVSLANTNCTDSVQCKLSCSQQNGVITSSGDCVGYDIVNRLCLKVDMMYSESGKSSAIILDSGCFEGGEAAYYVRAIPGKLYKLDYVPVEVRSKYDPYTALTEASYKVQTDLSPTAELIQDLSYIFLGSSLLFGFLTLIMYFRARSDGGEEEKALRN